jgi:hypothetical protein
VTGYQTPPLRDCSILAMNRGEVTGAAETPGRTPERHGGVRADPGASHGMKFESRRLARMCIMARGFGV